MNQYLKLAGIVIMLTFTIVFSGIFITAYLSPDKMVLVSIDAFNEANLELAIVLFTIPLSLWVVKAEITDDRLYDLEVEDG